MLRRTIALLMTSVVVFIVPAGCNRKPAEGKSCNAVLDGMTCLDPKAAATCEGGTWQKAPCLGPEGCKVTGELVECDTRFAPEASRCVMEGDVACTPDGKAMLRCRGKSWGVEERCLGPDGCKPAKLAVTCDSTLGVEGDICVARPAKTRVEYACSVDRKAILTCKDGKWKKVQGCTGPKGCGGTDTLDCDGATVSPGDFCVKEEKDDYACSPDRKAWLRCEAEGWKVVSACLGEKGCTDVGTDIECDDSVQEPNAACEKEDEGSAVCSTDGKSILECKQGKFVKTRACPGACKVDETTVGCL